MLTRIPLGCIALCALAFASLADEPATITPVFALHGRQCAMKTASGYLAKSPKEFEKLSEKLGLRINDHPVILEVDYTKYVVVVLCSGEGENFDYTTCRITETDGTLFVRYHNRVASSAAACIANYTPFSILVLERTQKKLVIEQNVELRKNERPKWVQRGVFEKLSENPKELPHGVAPMIRAVAVLVAVALVGGAALPTPVPNHIKPKKPLLYFPTTVGTKWVYQSRDQEWTQVVTAVEEKDGVFVVTYDTLAADGTTEAQYQRAVSEYGISLVAGKQVEFVPKQLCLKLPYKELETWKDEDLEVIYKSLKSERVKVPAGVFDAIPVEMETTTGHRVLGETSWYAPGVGVVKRSRGDVVLKSFTPGK
jgi:hypothetical protein